MNKKGSMLFFVVIALAVAAVLFSGIYWLKSLNEQAQASSADMEKESVAYARWREIELLPPEEIESKSGQEESSTMLGGKFNIKTVYGSRNGEANFTMPVSITVSDANGSTMPYTLRNEYLSNNAGSKYIRNGSFPNHDLGVAWDANAEILRMMADGHEIVEEGKNNYNGGDGYIVFDNGLTFEWGVLYTNFDGAEHTVNFPKAFPHKCMSVVTSAYQACWIGGIRFVSTKTFTNSSVTFVPNGGNGDFRIYWVAIGY